MLKKTGVRIALQKLQACVHHWGLMSPGTAGAAVLIMLTMTVTGHNCSCVCLQGQHCRALTRCGRSLLQLTMLYHCLSSNSLLDRLSPNASAWLQGMTALIRACQSGSVDAREQQIRQVSPAYHTKGSLCFHVSATHYLC